MSRRLRLVPRLAAWAVVGLVVVAVLLGRGTAAPEAKSPIYPRHPAHPRYQAFSGYLFPDDRPHQTRLLDTETGQVTLLEIGGEEGLDAVSCSPWQDAAGQYHLVGRRKAPKIDPLEGFAGGTLGIAHSTFPGGQVLDQITFELIPAAPPAWYPDQSDRILFAGCDGRLYELTFPGAEGPGNSATAIQPRRIRWKTAGPRKGPLHIQDPCWPSEQAFGGRLLAVLRFRKSTPESSDWTQLWWLQLNERGTAVVAAGRLIVPSSDALSAGAGAGAAWGEERCPSVGMAHDGTWMLSYVVLPEGRRPGGLWIAPITFETRDGNRLPRVAASAARLLAATCLAAPAAFSPDGRSIYAVVRQGPHDEPRVKRFSIPPEDSRPALTAQSLMLPSSG